MISKKLIDKFLEDVSALGALPAYLFISFFILLTGKQKAFFILIIALVISYIITFIIRAAYHKNRPARESYENSLEKLDASSFPSLHSARMVILSFIISYHYSEVLLTSFLVVASLLVIFTRYYLRKHYLSDLIGGAILGTIISWGLILI